MPKQHAPSDNGRRDAAITCLRELRPGLEAKGVRHAYLFGSVARGDAVQESDIDIILDLDPERHIGLFAFEAIQQFLESQLGQNVDLGSMRSLQPGRHDEIVQELVEAF